LNIIFGPIYSRRFGKSLGIDLSPQTKQCNYDCIYCELEPADTVDAQTQSLPVESIISAVQEGLRKHKDIDVLTITANGEPTLYPYLGELIDEINRIKGSTKTLILSNGSTISDPGVQDALLKIDIVKLSLDCATQKCLKRIDRMHNGIDLEQIKAGMVEFKHRTTHPLIIEILIVKGINDKASEIDALNDFLLELHPDRIDLGTIDRPPAYDVRPVTYETLYNLSKIFDPALPIYIASRKSAPKKQDSYNTEEIIATIAKRPLTQDDVSILFDAQSQQLLQNMLQNGKIKVKNNNGVDFFTIDSKNN
jgi:wyosine [tRNA(Phe)-imidazoG37] synthetase (radical SAM superfamily)